MDGEGVSVLYTEHIDALKEDEQWMIDDAQMEEEEWAKEWAKEWTEKEEEEETIDSPEPPEKNPCNGRLDMRKPNKGRIPYGLQVIGNSHTNYISHPNCKQCRGSICGICVRHGG